MSKMSKAIAALGVVAGLGVAALPLSSYAVEPETADITVKATINSSIALTVTGNDESSYADSTLDLGVLTLGTLKSGSVKVNVKTNNADGYTLGVKAKDGSADMKATSTGSVTSTIVAGDPSNGETSAWGFHGGDLGSASSWQTMTTTDQLLRANGIRGTEDTVVTFGVYAAGDQASGEYTVGVTFTATAK